MKPNSTAQESVVTDTSGKKKFSKPLMERRRRARINESLHELKALVLSSMNKDHSKFTKMEKADVLELTVNYLKTLDTKEQQTVNGPSHGSEHVFPRSSQKGGHEFDQHRNFLAGYNECAREVQQYLLRTDDVSPTIKARMLTHISTSPPDQPSSPLMECSPKENAISTTTPLTQHSFVKTSYAQQQATSVYPSPPASPVSNQHNRPLMMMMMNASAPNMQMCYSSENKASNFQHSYVTPAPTKKKQPLSDKSIWRPWVSM
eukprot:gene6168-6879_t